MIFVSNLRYIIKINVRSLRFIEEAKRFATEAERRETPKEYYLYKVRNASREDETSLLDYK